MARIPRIFNKEELDNARQQYAEYGTIGGVARSLGITYFVAKRLLLQAGCFSKDTICIRKPKRLARCNVCGIILIYSGTDVMPNDSPEAKRCWLCRMEFGDMPTKEIMRRYRDGTLTRLVSYEETANVSDIAYFLAKELKMKLQGDIPDSFPIKITLKLDLSGPQGNSFSIVSACCEAFKSLGYSKESINKIRNEATSGDYENLLDVFGRYFRFESDDEEDMFDYDSDDDEYYDDNERE